MAITTCSICGMEAIQITKHKKITGPPPGVKKYLNRKVTYGYFYRKYVCNCGNVWEVRCSL